MNAAFFLHLIACTSCLLFLASLFIGIQFRGEFGLISEETSEQSSDMDVHSALLRTLSDVHAFCSNRAFEKEGLPDARTLQFDVKSA